MFQTDRKQQTITIEGKIFTAGDIASILSGKMFFAGNSDFYLELFRFLDDWFNPAEETIIHTSGSTGKPKSMVVQKKFMIQSACITCEYLGLKPMDKILLCMPLSFIAGKMMVVRALVGGLDLYLTAPTGHPLKDTEETFQFASMVPLQIFNCLQEPLETERLHQVKNLLIGGGAINPALEKALQGFPNNVYASYGMAETVSHVALRKVNGPEATLNFTPLPSVNITLSEENALIVEAPLVCAKTLHTNDVAEIFPNGTFRILGRKDNVIVTGGLKVQAETLETTLSALIHVPFAITSLPDPKFGEKIVLAVEEPIDETRLKNHLPSFQVPKRIIVVSIPRTESGKIDRAALKELVKSKEESLK
jgi:Acyl-CoA synthetases (AMP-forming)/AMP-acid ligases II